MENTTTLEKTSKIIGLIMKYSLILFVSISGIIISSQQLSKSKRTSELNNVIFKSDEDFLQQLANTPDYYDQQVLMQASIDQKAFEIKYGRKLRPGEKNPYSSSNSAPFLTIGIIVVTSLILIFLIHLIFKPIINLKKNINLYQNKKLTISQFKGKWNTSLICSLIISLLLAIPTLGISLLLFIPHFILKSVPII